MRSGIGYDAHRFDDTRDLVLGGVHIPGSPGLGGHSDADALCHAIADALLGAAALGDLGTHFPNDERWKDSSSLEILAEVARLLRDAAWTPVNIDASVIAETPRLEAHREKMVASVAAALGIEVGRVSIKATTTDGMGFVGRKEGIAAIAVASIQPLG